MRRTGPIWRDGAWWIRARETHVWSRWDPASGRWVPMGWQPPPRGVGGAQEAPPGSSRRDLADRMRGFLMLAVLIGVTLPGLWIVLWDLSDEEPCPESASIVEETRLSNVPENALFAMLPDHPHDWPLTIDAPTDLSFAAQGHGSTPGAEQDWRDALVLHGFRSGRVLAWGESAGANRPAIWAHTNEFASSGDALSFHRWAAGWSCRFMA